MRILFATPEVSDFVQVGGLAAVSAALPRALQALADIRLVVPGYSQVLAGPKDFTILDSFPAFAGLPAFEVGFGRAADGLPYYVVVCAGLFERAIGHRTGGLSETILDGETGFLFGKPSADGRLGGLCRAFSTFGMKDNLDRMRRAAMAQAFSWTESARSYAALYETSI